MAVLTVYKNRLFYVFVIHFIEESWRNSVLSHMGAGDSRIQKPANASSKPPIFDPSVPPPDYSSMNVHSPPCWPSPSPAVAVNKSPSSFKSQTKRNSLDDHKNSASSTQRSSIEAKRIRFLNSPQSDGIKSWNGTQNSRFSQPASGAVRFRAASYNHRQSPVSQPFQPRTSLAHAPPNLQQAPPNSRLNHPKERQAGVKDGHPRMVRVGHNVRPASTKTHPESSPLSSTKMADGQYNNVTVVTSANFTTFTPHNVQMTSTSPSKPEPMSFSEVWSIPNSPVDTQPQGTSSPIQSSPVCADVETVTDSVSMVTLHLNISTVLSPRFISNVCVVKRVLYLCAFDCLMLGNRCCWQRANYKIAVKRKSRAKKSKTEISHLV